MPVAALVPVAASVPAWTGIHSAAWGSCTATAVVETDTGMDTGISPCMGLALAWAWAFSQEVWAPLLAACTAKQAVGMGTGTDTGISPCTWLALSWGILVDHFLGGLATSIFLMILPALQQSLEESLSASKGPDTRTLSFSYTIFSMTNSLRSVQ